MTDWRHDEWCATFLDGAPESECDCVRRNLIELEQRIGIAERSRDDWQRKSEFQTEHITRLERSRIGLRAELALANMRLKTAVDAIERVTIIIRDESDPDAPGRPWLVEKVLRALNLDKSLDG